VSTTHVKPVTSLRGNHHPILGVGSALVAVTAVGAAVAVFLTPPAAPAVPATPPAALRSYATLPAIGVAPEYVGGRSQASAPLVDSQAAAEAAAARMADHHAGVHALASDGLAEGQTVGAMRVLLRDRGFGLDVTAGPMTALPPGAVARSALDDEMEAFVTPYQPEAWLIQTEAGRWWLWESGATAPADHRAETYQTHVQRHGSSERRVD
jgi:hypothetical protein